MKNETFYFLSSNRISSSSPPLYFCHSWTKSNNWELNLITSSIKFCHFCFEKKYCQLKLIWLKIYHFGLKFFSCLYNLWSMPDCIKDNSAQSLTTLTQVQRRDIRISGHRFRIVCRRVEPQESGRLFAGPEKSGWELLSNLSDVKRVELDAALHRTDRVLLSAVVARFLATLLQFFK